MTSPNGHGATLEVSVQTNTPWHCSTARKSRVFERRFRTGCRQLRRQTDREKACRQADEVGIVRQVLTGALPLDPGNRHREECTDRCAAGVPERRAPQPDPGPAIKSRNSLTHDFPQALVCAGMYCAPRSSRKHEACDRHVVVHALIAPAHSDDVTLASQKVAANAATLAGSSAMP